MPVNSKLYVKDDVPFTMEMFWALTDAKYDSKDHPFFELHHIKARGRGVPLDDDEKKALLRLRWIQVWLRVQARVAAAEEEERRRQKAKKRNKRKRRGAATGSAETRKAQEVPSPRGKEEEEIKAAETMRLGKWNLNEALRALIPYVCPLTGVTADFLQVAHLVGHEDRKTLPMTLVLCALEVMPWGIDAQEDWKEQVSNAMPFNSGLHKIFDAGEAAFLPKHLQAYVEAFERFVASKVKARQSFSLRDFDWGELSRIINHYQAHQLEFILFAGAQKTELRVSTTDDSLPVKDESHSTTHEVDLSEVPNPVDEPLPTILSFWDLVAVVVDYCFKAAKVPGLYDDPKTQWARYLFRLFFVNSGAAFAKALGTRPFGRAHAEVRAAADAHQHEAKPFRTYAQPTAEDVREAEAKMARLAKKTAKKRGSGDGNGGAQPAKKRRRGQ